MKPRPVTSPPIPAATNARTGPVTVDIDELVLFGFDRAAAAEFAGELRAALTRALAENGPPAWWTEAGDSYTGRSNATDQRSGHPHGDDRGDQRHLAHLEVSIGATDSPAAIAENLATQLCAGATTRGGGQP